MYVVEHDCSIILNSLYLENKTDEEFDNIINRTLNGQKNEIHAVEYQCTEFRDGVRQYYSDDDE
jgi:hypothetical protein